MLYLRSLKLTNSGDRKNPRMMLRCNFTASKNKYAKSFPVNIFENSSLEDVYAALCEDFGVEEEDKIYRVEDPVEFEGELFTQDVPAHYVSVDGERIKNEKGDNVVSTSLTTVCVTDWGQTKESVVNSFIRTWTKSDLLVETDEE